MKKIVALALLFTLFWGCEVTDDDGWGECPEALPFFDINGLNVEHRLFDTTCCGNVILNDERVPFENFSIFGSYDYSLHAFQPTTGGFMSRSYALSCIAGGHEGSKETIDEFVVTTHFDINENYQAGDTINDLLTFNDFLSVKTLNEFLADEERAILSPQFFLQLTERPTATDTASFTINIVLDNGERYTESTPRVIFAQ